MRGEEKNTLKGLLDNYSFILEMNIWDVFHFYFSSFSFVVGVGGWGGGGNLSTEDIPIQVKGIEK